MLVKIKITLIGNNFNKKAGIPSVPALDLVLKAGNNFFDFLWGSWVKIKGVR